jgi:hypothetical protein
VMVVVVVVVVAVGYRRRRVLLGERSLQLRQLCIILLGTLLLQPRSLVDPGGGLILRSEVTLEHGCGCAELFAVGRNRTGYWKTKESELTLEGEGCNARGVSVEIYPKESQARATHGAGVLDKKRATKRAREGGVWRSGRKSVSDAQGGVDLGPGDRNTCLRQ